MVETLNHVGVGTCQLCDHIITANTFTTKACVEIFKIQSEPLNCNSEKVLYLLRCKICDCLGATLLLSLYLLNVVTVILSFHFVTSFIFINHHPSFLISFFHPSIGREFNMLSSSGIIYPYPSVVWVSRLS